jgi:hypothetical protein
MVIIKYSEKTAINLVEDLYLERSRQKETNYVQRQRISPLITNNMFQFHFEYCCYMRIAKYSICIYYYFIAYFLKPPYS